MKNCKYIIIFAFIVLLNLSTTGLTQNTKPDFSHVYPIIVKEYPGYLHAWNVKVEENNSVVTDDNIVNLEKWIIRAGYDLENSNCFKLKENSLYEYVLCLAQELENIGMFIPASRCCKYLGDKYMQNQMVIKAAEYEISLGDLNEANNIMANLLSNNTDKDEMNDLMQTFNSALKISADKFYDSQNWGTAGIYYSYLKMQTDAKECFKKAALQAEDDKNYLDAIFLADAADMNDKYINSLYSKSYVQSYFSDYHSNNEIEARLNDANNNYNYLRAAELNALLHKKANASEYYYQVAQSLKLAGMNKLADYFTKKAKSYSEK